MKTNVQVFFACFIFHVISTGLNNIIYDLRRSFKIELGVLNFGPVLIKRQLKYLPFRYVILIINKHVTKISRTHDKE